MKCFAATLFGLLAACSPRGQPAAVSAGADEIPQVVVSAAGAGSGSANAAPPQSGPHWRAPIPTLATAGAHACRILPPVLLGARGSGHTIVGFGPSGGVATFKRDAVTLVIQRIASDGGMRGKPITASVGNAFEPKYVFWVDAGFLILLRLWDWQNGHVAWRALLFDRGGSAGVPVDIGLEGVDVRVGQVLDERRVGLVVADAGLAKPAVPGRWQTVTVRVNGAITSRAQTVTVDDLVTTTNDAWEAAKLDEKLGWVVLRDGERRPEGVFDGERKAAQAASLLRPSAGIVAQVWNTAEPPPRGPGGRIIEAMGRPTLVRTHQRKEIGERLLIEWRGNPVGAIAMNIESLLFWSGTHFIYPFRGDDGACLLPIDCRP